MFFDETVLTKLRNGMGNLNHRTINKRCTMFNCQSNNIIERELDDE